MKNMKKYNVEFKSQASQEESAKERNLQKQKLIEIKNK